MLDGPCLVALAAKKNHGPCVLDHIRAANSSASLVGEDSGGSMFPARRAVTRWVAIRQACGDLLFCIGVVMLPALLAANLTVWLACQDLSRADCTDLLVLSVAQGGSDEVRLNRSP
jgi:hypothetical protein